MRQTVPKFALVDSIDSNLLSFLSDDGNTLEIRIVDHFLVKVTHIPHHQQSSKNMSHTLYNNELPPPNNFGDKPHPTKINNATVYSLSTKFIRVDCELSDDKDLVLKWYDISGPPRLFQEDLPYRAYAYERHSGVYHYTKSLPNQVHVGLGEHTGVLQLNERKFRLESMDALGYNAESTDPLYKVTPFYITIDTDSNDTFAYGTFYDNLSTGYIDFSKEIDAFWGPYRVYKAESGILDYYVITGVNVEKFSPIETIIERYAHLVGKPALIPRFGLGYLASSMGYADSENAQELLEEFPKKCRENDIPCDLMHLSSGYTVDPNNGSRNVFTWNEKRFPHPKRFVDRYIESGIRIAANVKPWFLKCHPMYDLGAEKKAYILSHQTRMPRETRLWSAGAGDTGSGSYFDFSSSGGRELWKAGIKSLLDLGIEGIWNDNNEFALPDDDDIYSFNAAGVSKIDRERTVGQCGRSVQTMLMASASYEAMVEHSPQRRPFLITRSAAPGVHKFAVQTWSGDNSTSWHTLKYNIPIGLSSGLSLLPVGYGHDVGGFYGPQPSPELLVRWVQNGIFHPRFCIHSWKSEGVTEPWMFPEVTNMIRDAIKFRYQLIPYLYNLHYEAHTTGHPVIRPLFYHFLDDRNCLQSSFDFMLGPHLLVASVFEESARERIIYLPRLDSSEKSWCCIWTGQWFDGGSTVTIPVPLEQKGAVFAIRDAMIPFGRVMRNTTELDDYRVIRIFPSPNCAGSGEYVLVEDDGNSSNPALTKIRVWMSYDEKCVRVGIEILSREYQLAYKAIWLALPEGDERLLVGSDVAKVADGRSMIAINLEM